MTVTALYSDGVTVIPSGIAQIVENVSGSVVEEVAFANGVCTIEKPAGDYTDNTTVDGTIVGSLNFHINAGDVLTLSIVTN